MEVSKIAEWYGSQHIFITGATGFMGKILVEKILRCCPNVASVYILVRPKKGKEAHQRKEEFVNSPVFENLCQLPNSQKLLEKLQCINGDVTQANCGLSEQDATILKTSVTAVFHMAANVRFDQPLKTLLLMNTGGTLNVLELACQFENLKMFMHVSTSYCHCGVTKLEEKLYKAPQNPRKMLDLVDWLDDKLIETLSPELLKGYPNTYAYSKCLSEQLVSEYSHKLPIVITRPSIVIAAYKEPIPGWVDNINGPTGILIGAGKGVIRTMHCNTELSADFVPVDMVINSMLAIGWKVGSEDRKTEAEVYHITADTDTSMSWGQALELGRKYVFSYPFSVCLWYPGGSPKSSYLLHVIAAFFLHLIPAYFVDFIMTISGNKPFLVKTQKRIQNGLTVLQYYTTRNWYFHNEKLKKLVGGLSDTDREVFYTHVEKYDLDKFMCNYVLGARKYCVREELDTLPYARKVMKRLFYLDLLKNILIGVFLLWLSYIFITSCLDKVKNPLFS